MPGKSVDIKLGSNHWRESRDKTINVHARPPAVVSFDKVLIALPSLA